MPPKKRKSSTSSAAKLKKAKVAPAPVDEAKLRTEIRERVSEMTAADLLRLHAFIMRSTTLSIVKDETNTKIRTQGQQQDHDIQNLHPHLLGMPNALLSAIVGFMDVFDIARASAVFKRMHKQTTLAAARLQSFKMPYMRKKKMNSQQRMSLILKYPSITELDLEDCELAPTHLVKVLNLVGKNLKKVVFKGKPLDKLATATGALTHLTVTSGSFPDGRSLVAGNPHLRHLVAKAGFQAGDVVPGLIQGLVDTCPPLETMKVSVGWVSPIILKELFSGCVASLRVLHISSRFGRTPLLNQGLTMALGQGCPLLEDFKIDLPSQEVFDTLGNASVFPHLRKLVASVGQGELTTLNLQLEQVHELGLTAGRMSYYQTDEKTCVSFTGASLPCLTKLSISCGSLGLKLCGVNHLLTTSAATLEEFKLDSISRVSQKMQSSAIFPQMPNLISDANPPPPEGAAGDPGDAAVAVIPPALAFPNMRMLSVYTSNLEFPRAEVPALIRLCPNLEKLVVDLDDYGARITEEAVFQALPTLLKLRSVNLKVAQISMNMCPLLSTMGNLAQLEELNIKYAHKREGYLSAVERQPRLRPEELNVLGSFPELRELHNLLNPAAEGMREAVRLLSAPPLAPWVSAWLKKNHG